MAVRGLTVEKKDSGRCCSVLLLVHSRPQILPKIGLGNNHYDLELGFCWNHRTGTRMYDGSAVYS